MCKFHFFFPFSVEFFFPKRYYLGCIKVNRDVPRVGECVGEWAGRCGGMVGWGGRKPGWPAGRAGKTVVIPVPIQFRFQVMFRSGSPRKSSILRFFRPSVDHFAPSNEQNAVKMRNHGGRCWRKSRLIQGKNVLCIDHFWTFHYFSQFGRVLRFITSLILVAFCAMNHFAPSNEHTCC